MITYEKVYGGGDQPLYYWIEPHPIVSFSILDLCVMILLN